MTLSGVILTAAALFTVTNIDGFIVLTALFGASTGGVLRPWQIIAGQYAGFVAIVVVSGFAAAGLVRIPERWIGLIGVLPLALGVWGLAKARGSPDGELPFAKNGLLTVVIAVLANGIDNIAVYTSLFALSGIDKSATSVAVFLVMVAMWCTGAWFLGRNKKTVSLLVHVGKWLAPAVFVLIGLTILFRTGVLVRLAGEL